MQEILDRSHVLMQCYLIHKGTKAAHRVRQVHIINSMVGKTEEEINKWVKECLRFLRDNPDEPFKYIGSGDTMVIAFRHDGDEEYYVIVSNGYHDCYIPFEDEDYE